MKTYCFLLLCLYLILIPNACASNTDASKPIAYATIDELLWDPLFNRELSDGTVLDATIDVTDYVIGILYNANYESYQFFGVNVVEEGYVLDVVSDRQSASGDYGFLMKFNKGDYTVHFAIGQSDLAEGDQFLDSKIMSNGKTIKIGFSHVPI